MTEILKTIGSSVAKLRALLAEARKDLERIATLQNTLAECLTSLWDNTEQLTQDPIVWKESLSLVASGRILGIAAQAEELLTSTTDASRTKSWISDGTEYSKWIGKGVNCLVIIRGSGKAAAQLCGKAFSLGHPDVIVENVLSSLVFAKPALVVQFHELLSLLSRYEQKQFMVSTIKLISRLYLGQGNESFSEGATAKVHEDVEKKISGCSALLKSLLVSGTVIEHEMCEWLISNPCSNILARAILIAQSPQSIKKVLDKSWQQFGDQLRIRHTPIIQQESTAQILLMTAGYVYQLDPKYVFNKARSGTHTSGISDHIGSTSPRIRFLGMVVGMAISHLVDQPESQMAFDDKDMKTLEGIWYSKLVEVNDRVGSINDLHIAAPQPAVRPLVPKKRLIEAKTVKSAKPKIVEVLDDDNESLEGEFAPYEKPDSDAEGEDEDPTLVKRNVAKAPVYIRDLIAGLKDTDEHDRHLLALSTAAPLIRRKVDFGSELKDRLEELALTLVGLGDPFELDDWHDMRQQAMVATIVAQPRQMGPWYARAYFNGDYSISQRASVLVSLGLAARELAGYQREIQPRAPFASKQLPERLHILYAQMSEVDSLSRQLEQTMLQPVSRTKQRTKIIRNDLAGLVAESFFFPLTGYWHSFTSPSHARGIFFDPFLLPLFLKTIAIITSAAGTSTVLLPQMTTEFWQLLLSLRSHALNDSAILEAELFSFLTILNVNEDRRNLASECSTQVLETQEWVGMVFEKLPEGDDEKDRCKVLAAGVLVAIKAIVEKYHRLMVGDMLRM